MLKLEVMLDESKKNEFFSLLDKRVDYVKRLNPKKKKELTQMILEKTLKKNPKILIDALNQMNNVEFFDLVKDC